MPTSFVRRSLTSCFALVALAPLVALSACSTGTASEGAANIRFAVSTTSADAAISPTVRVGEVRVLSRHVNLQEPVVMGVAGNDVTVTFALRQREGATFTMDPESLERKAVTPYAYPVHAKRATPPFAPGEQPDAARLESGGSLSCWTNEASRRVMVQAFDAKGGWRGAPVAVSPEEMDVFGAPHIATAEGHRFVVTFVVSDEERFQLVATSIESVR